MKRKGVLCWLAVALILVMAMALANCSDGSDGSSGLSAYEIAVNNGFTGTEQEWLASLGSDSGFETCALCHEYAGEDHQASYDLSLIHI